MPGAGMLGWSLRHRGEELLGHPASLSKYLETGEPTGVALLHPWANRLAGPRYPASSAGAYRNAWSASGSGR